MSSIEKIICYTFNCNYLLLWGPSANNVLNDQNKITGTTLTEINEIELDVLDSNNVTLESSA